MGRIKALSCTTCAHYRTALGVDLSGQDVSINECWRGARFVVGNDGRTHIGSGWVNIVSADQERATGECGPVGRMHFVRDVPLRADGLHHRLFAWLWSRIVGVVGW